ncbi:TonB-dependent siderophore receptor [Massilia sp. TS11]|uniref:TonB-dependent receptor plug domain-containing protein n=1 Tax=Massilia sp. TS11 TaxID=2908003 RepID=UPI001ED9CF17|nr:TonB-dependent receptor [Massilia sp. TS11]MCG2584504.1 TonB-dependent receptor [Massilia sp. TS11]
MPNHSLPRLSVVAFASALLCAQVQADETKPSAAKPKEEDKTIQKVEVKGTADAYDPRRDDTASKIVVGREEILKYGDSTILDVMKRLPGVTVVGSSVRLRGLGSYTQILVNGERPPAGFSLDNLPPEQIEKIEIVRAATAEYSTQSIAGTINVILKKSVQKASREVRAGYGAEPNNYNVSAGFSMSDKVDTLSYTLGANSGFNKNTNFNRTDETREDATGVLMSRRVTDFSNDNRYVYNSGNARLAWQLQDGDSLAWQNFFNAGHGHSENQGQELTLAGPVGPYAQQQGRFRSSYAYGRSELNPVLKLEGSAKLDLKLSYAYSSNENSGYRAAQRNGATTLDRTSSGEGRDHTVGSTGKYTRPGAEDHALAVGWDLSQGQRRDTQHQLDRVASTDGLNFDNLYEARIRRAAVFAQDEWNVSKAWSVYLGARWEGIESTSHGSGYADSSSRSSVFSPLFQTLYKIPERKGDQLRLALTKTYKAPNLSSLIPRRYYSALNSATAPDYSGNPRLQPELAVGVDAGYERYWAEGALFSVSLSTRRISNYTHNGIVIDKDRYLAMPLNLGSAESHGIELELKFPLSALMADAPKLDLRANVSRNWSRVDNVPGPDNRLDRQTPLSLNLGADYKHEQLSAGFNFAFRQGGMVRSSDKERSYDTYGRDLEVYGLWKFSAQDQLRLTARNMLKQGYHNENVYEDGSGTMRARFDTERGAGWRINFEHKF